MNKKIAAAQLASASEVATELLKALANRHRLMIVCQLLDRERSVGELADLIGLRHSSVSQHLALLRKDGLVATRRDGQTVWYAIASNGARAVVEALYHTYCGADPQPGRRRKA